VAELFPTRLRATRFGLGVSIGRMPAIAGPLVTGIMATQIGIGNVARWFADLDLPHRRLSDRARDKGPSAGRT
jgi:hypothetical protein